MYTLRTFNGLTVGQDGELAGQTAVRVPRKAMALLAVLSAEGSVSRERLMSLFWPDSGSGRAKGSLNQALHLLRLELKCDDLLQGNTEIRLNPDYITSDVIQFRQAAKNGDHDKAVQLYTGPFLNGVHLEGAPDFEDWAYGHRLDMEKQYQKVLESLAIKAGSAGNHELAAGWWRKLQNTDQLNSRVAAGLMLSLAQSGDRAAALRHAVEHHALLKKELGLSPDPAIENLEVQIRESGSTSETPAHTVLAAPSHASAHRPAPDEGTAAHSHTSSHQSAPDERKATSSHVPAHKPAPAGSVLWRRMARLPGVPALFTAILIVLGMYAAYILLGRQDNDLNPPARTLSQPVPKLPDNRSIAVLPFINLSSEEDQEYFSDGMTDELISSLGRIGGLKVAARTSAFQFKGKNPDVREVREKLAVAYVLEGSVRRSGNLVRLNVRLADTESGFQIWSDQYERNIDDIFELQDEISRTIINEVGPRIKDDIRTPVRGSHSRDIRVYEDYLRGLYFFNQLQIPNAIRYFEEAIKGDPQFSRAYAALAEAYAVPAAYSELSPVDSRMKGIEAAQAALRIDPSLPEAHSALGWLELIGLEWESAEKSLRRGIELDPDAARARLYYAVYLHRQGNKERSFLELQIARQADPLSLTVNSLYASFLGDLGRDGEAIEHLLQTIELYDSFPIAHAVLAHIYMGTGQIGHAVEHYERAYGIVPSSFYAGFLGHAYAKAGRTDDARMLLDDLLDRSRRGDYVSPGAAGWIYLGLEEWDEGYAWLETAVAQRDVFLTIYGVLSNSRLAAPYRDDPRFIHLRTSAGLNR